MPTFRKRRAAMTFASSLVSTAVNTPQTFSLIDEDDEVPSYDGYLRPHNRKAVDAGGVVLLSVDFLEDDFTFREMVTIHIGDGVGATSVVS